MCSYSTLYLLPLHCNLPIHLSVYSTGSEDMWKAVIMKESKLDKKYKENKGLNSGREFQWKKMLKVR